MSPPAVKLEKKKKKQRWSRHINVLQRQGEGQVKKLKKGGPTVLASLIGIACLVAARECNSGFLFCRSTVTLHQGQVHQNEHPSRQTDRHRDTDTDTLSLLHTHTHHTHHTHTHTTPHHTTPHTPHNTHHTPHTTHHTPHTTHTHMHTHAHTHSRAQ